MRPHFQLLVDKGLIYDAWTYSYINFSYYATCLHHRLYNMHTIWCLHYVGENLEGNEKMAKYVVEWYNAISLFNTLRPRQNGRHFADDTFKRIFLNENVGISIKISPKFVPKGPVNNIPASVQIMAWRRTGDKPLSEPMMTQFNDAYMRHSASMSLSKHT